MLDPAIPAPADQPAVIRGDPHCAVPVFQQRFDLWILGYGWRSEIHELETHVGAALNQAKHAGDGPDPDGAGAIFQQRGNRASSRVFARMVNGESLPAIVRLDAHVARRVQSGEAITGGYPINAGSGLEQVGDTPMRQSIRHREVREASAVEAGQPFGGAEPQEPARVADYPVDEIARESLSDCVALDRKLLGPQGAEPGEHADEAQPDPP